MFYKTNVDISNTKSMWNFLHNHFTYFTLNSWNGLRSIANNMKCYKLNLEGDFVTALNFLNDEEDVGGLQSLIQEKINDFVTEYSMFKVYVNGRSGGYLVLYNRDNNCSILPDWITDYSTYEDFKEDLRVNGECVRDYLSSLRGFTQVVRAFDILCDEIRDLVNEYSKLNFEATKLGVAVDLFNDLYGDEIKSFNLSCPEIENNYVNLNACATYTSFLECFLTCLGEHRPHVDIVDGKLYLKEY